MTDDVEIRELRPEDEPGVRSLLAASLGASDDHDYARFYRWKHHENPFGASPGWVAVAQGEIVGLRVFLRWEFLSDGEVVPAVRAVDTATHPAHQGKGIFRRLTLHGCEQLAADGTRFVFNTPNDASRPGYLKMGWEEVGRLPAVIRLRSARGALRTVRSRTAADRGSLPTEVGTPASAAFADPGEVEELLTRLPAFSGLMTRRHVPYLQWRYGADWLHYRVLLCTDRLADGALVFRLRRRGRATELVVNELLAPIDAADEVGALVTRALRATGADHAIAIAQPGTFDASLSPPGLGPVLVWRDLVGGQTRPPLEDWSLGMGDVELF